MKKKLLVVCTTDSMIWNFLIPHIQKWSSEGYDVECLCSCTGFYFEELEEKYHLHMTEIPFLRNPLKLGNLKCLMRIRRHMRQNSYDAILCQEPVGGVMGRLAGIGNKVKVLYTAHGFHFYKGAPLKNWLFFYPIEKVLSYVTDVLITSNHEDFEFSKKMNAKKIYKINGVGVNLDCISTAIIDRKKKCFELNIPEDAKIILNAAELIPRKNHITALKAFSKLELPNCYYLICGDGELYDVLVDLATSLGVKDRVKFLGFRKDLNELYKLADVFFFPSYQEGLSVALLGAMAAALPVVCSRIRGNVDLIENGKRGYLYNADDVEGFTKGLQQILTSENDFGKENLEFVKQFSVDKAVENMYRILKDEVGL